MSGLWNLGKAAAKAAGRYVKNKTVNKFNEIKDQVLSPYYNLKNKYDKLSDNKKKSLDRWYFNAYYATLDKTLPQPTTDKVLPMEEMIQKIDADDRPIYLNYCDCRSLTGECGLPTRTCITYKNGINSFVDRGLSEQIDKERAKEIIRETDRVGLMHTVAMGGICNCCGDCCYLFRSLKRLDSAGRWPLSEYIAQLNEEKCKKDN